MGELQDLQARVVAFCEERDWQQFHNPKDLAISLLLEAGEVLEHFQWRSPQEIVQYTKGHKGEIADELADVLSWILLMAHYLNIDLNQAVTEKMTQNQAKYPVAKSKGNHKKYSELASE